MAENSPRDYFRTKKRYVQVGHLGRGGMAVVSESKDEYFQRKIAFKKLKAGPGLAKRTEEFIREALIMGKLEHPGVVPIHDLIEEPGETGAITMNKVSGLSLAEKIAEAKKNPEGWPFNQRIRQFQKLVEIVAYSHSRNIIHRDIKPANVMIGEYGEVILLDWGLAKVNLSKDAKIKTKEKWDPKIIDGSSSVTGSIKGTPYYMSPEAASGKTALVKETSDVFGLGAVLYEFITLSYLIKGNKAIDVLNLASEGDYHPYHIEYLNEHIKADVQKVPEELHYILQRAIAKSPQDRYPTAAEFNEDLQNFINEVPIVGFGSFPYKAKKWFLKNGFWVMLMCLPLLFTAIFLKVIQRDVNDSKTELFSLEEQLKKEVKTAQGQSMRRDRLKNQVQNLELSLESIKESMLKEENRFLDSQDELTKTSIELDIKKRELEKLRSENEFRKVDLELVEDEMEEFSEEISIEKQKHQRYEQLHVYKNFLENTVPYGNRLIQIRKHLENHRYAQAENEILSDDSLSIDPYAVKWLTRLIVKEKKSSHDKKKFDPWIKVGMIKEEQKALWLDRHHEEKISVNEDLLQFLDLPKGYRVLNNSRSEGPWLIGFLSSIKSRFKNLSPYNGERTEMWTIKNCRPVTTFSDGAQGWLLLNDKGELFSFRPNLPIRPLMPLDVPIRQIFKIDMWNLALSQDENNRVYVYYLNTGQYLFSPGVTDSIITDVGVDDDLRLMLQMDDESWITPRLK